MPNLTLKALNERLTVLETEKTLADSVISDRNELIEELNLRVAGLESLCLELRNKNAKWLTWQNKLNKYVKDGRRYVVYPYDGLQEPIERVDSLGRWLYDIPSSIFEYEDCSLFLIRKEGAKFCVLFDVAEMEEELEKLKG